MSEQEPYIPAPIQGEIDKLMAYFKPLERDPTLVVLKAHLLAEEQLFNFLCRIATYSSPVNDARLSFAQLLALSKAFHKFNAQDWWVWSALQRLNSLRNHLAHNFAPTNLDKRLIEYAQFVADAISNGKPELENELEKHYSFFAKTGVHPFLLSVLATHITLTQALNYDLLAETVARIRDGRRHVNEQDR